MKTTSYVHPIQDKIATFAKKNLVIICMKMKRAGRKAMMIPSYTVSG